jgi:deoxyribodipyrimidine photo-lyase
LFRHDESNSSNVLLNRLRIVAERDCLLTTVVWFRQDLRLADNPALYAARDAAAVPVYLFAPAEEGAWAPAGAARWWLHHSLASLSQELAALGSRLILRRCEDSLDELMKLARECGARRIVWNRRYEPDVMARDARIKSALRQAGLEAQSYNASLLHEPQTVKTQSGTPFQVFTPFWRHCLAQTDPPAPQAAPAALVAPECWPPSQRLEDFELLPTPDWSAGMRAAWTPGSAGARENLQRFLRDAFTAYSSQRDRPDLSGTSRLSPHLHVGEIGPRQIWHAAQQAAAAQGDANWRQSQFLTELGWREFAHHLLFHFPNTPLEALRPDYRRFPWKSNPAALRLWQRGATGYPIVDAGMRELWQTGWMHNRIRMIAASFLVKDLLLPWQDGARWFWDTLVDADLASNTLGWQWVAGCGADAAPYFRIFNPVLQGQRFDPEGRYVRRWVPELAQLPTQWIHQPWSAPPQVLGAAGLTLGDQYPRPLVDHAEARTDALAALATVKK